MDQPTCLPAQNSEGLDVLSSGSVCSNSDSYGNLYSQPPCWTKEQFFFQKENAWVGVNSRNGGLYCSTCRLVKNVSVHESVTAGIRSSLSAEWIEGIVKAYGDTKSTQQKSLRKKLYDHRDSLSHKKAEDIRKIHSSEILREKFSSEYREMYSATTHVFRTAYYIAMNNRPYTDHPSLLNLQAANGVDIGRVLHSNVICSDIIDHIASEMRTRIVSDIVTNKPKISVLIDESTNLARKSCLIVYLRCCLGGSPDIEPVTFF